MDHEINEAGAFDLVGLAIKRISDCVQEMLEWTKLRRMA
jgi:hypothetical protein